MGFFEKLKDSLAKTRENLTAKIEKLIIGYADIDDKFLEELEETLILSDVGMATTDKLMAAVKKGIRKKQINSPEDLRPFLQSQISEILSQSEEEQESQLTPENTKPYVILVIGVNGAGKTTTIGKLSSYYRS